MRIIGDRFALERAVSNLIQNAIDRGGPNIVIDVDACTIEVKDDGGGTPYEERSRIECKYGGWREFTIPRAFVNQGDCIRFVKTGH